MIRKLLLIMFFLFLSSSWGLELKDLNSPRPFLGRFANGDRIELNSKSEKIKEEITLAPSISNITSKKAPEAQVKQAKNKEVKNKEKISKENNDLNTQSIGFADLSLKKLALDIADELDMDSSKINSDLSILWAATTERSETMKYIIYKLSNPDEDKPDDSIIKKIIRPIANFTSLAGASVAGDPYVATSALIGGGLINAFMKDDKEYNYKFSKVSDADMVVLVRKIDELQKKLLDLYIDYKTKEQLVAMTKDNFKKREDIYKNSQNKSQQELTVADAYYRNAKADAQKAMDDYLTSRTILENLVGDEVLKKIEQ